jgi:hypothetical protein
MYQILVYFDGFMSCTMNFLERFLMVNIEYVLYIECIILFDVYPAPKKKNL